MGVSSEHCGQRVNNRWKHYHTLSLQSLSSAVTPGHLLLSSLWVDPTLWTLVNSIVDKSSFTMSIIHKITMSYIHINMSYI